MLPISGRSLIDFSGLKSAADLPIRIARPDVVTRLCHAACTACRAWSHGSAGPALFRFVVKSEPVWRIDILSRIFLGFLFHARPLRFFA